MRGSDRPGAIAPPPPLAGVRGGLLPPHLLAPPWPALAEEDEGTGLGLLPPPPLAGVIGGLLPPHPLTVAPPPPRSPRLARLGAWRFTGLGTSGPRAEEGRVPKSLGGAGHRRVAAGSEPGRAWEAGRARPS